MTDILIFISYTASYNIILTNLLGEDKKGILKGRLVLLKVKLDLAFNNVKPKDRYFVPD